MTYNQRWISHFSVGGSRIENTTHKFNSYFYKLEHFNTTHRYFKCINNTPS